MLIGVLPAIPPQSSAHAASSYLADENGQTEITVDVEDEFQVVLYVIDITGVAGYECKITVSGPATPIDTAVHGDWFADGHTIFDGIYPVPADYHTAMLLSPLSISGSGAVVVFTLHADEEGSVAINVDSEYFLFGDKYAQVIEVDLPSTLYVAVNGGDGLLMDQQESSEQVSKSSLQEYDDGWFWLTAQVRGCTQAYIRITQEGCEPFEWEVPDCSPFDALPITLEALVDTERFVRWIIDGQDYTENPREIPFDSDTTVVLVCRALRTLQSSPPGAVSGADLFEGGTGASLSAPSTYSYESEVYSFHHWSLYNEMSETTARLPAEERDTSFVINEDVTATAVYGRVIYVGPNETWTTIQEGINAAEEGDTVVVRDGTYSGAGNTNLNFGVGGITVRSENGPVNCKIDCAGEEAARAVRFSGYEGQGSLLEGFTIKNGVGLPAGGREIGGAIYCSNSSPTIRGNVFESNYAEWYGGAIGITGVPNSNANIFDNTFQNNHVASLDGHDGGAIYILYGKLHRVEGNTFTQNSAARGHGGAIRMEAVQDNVYLIGNTVLDNTAHAGGGINIHSMLGGKTVFLMNNVIAGNTATLTTSIAEAGGVYIGNHPIVMVHNTIADNEAEGAGGDGGGAKLLGSGTETNPSILHNSIVWGNAASDGPQLWLGGSLLRITFSDMQGGRDDIFGSVPDAYDDNLAVDPRFANPLARDYHEKSRSGRWSDGEWIIDGETSPCIDAGDPADDYDLEPSPNGGRVNMGAYGNTEQASKCDCSFLPIVSTFLLKDQSTQSLLFTNSNSVNITIAADPYEGRSITGYMVTQGAQAPSPEDPGWQSSVTSYEFDAQPGTEVTLYGWAIDDQDSVGSASASILYDTRTPVVTGFTFTPGESGTAIVTWQTDIPAEGQVKYGPVSLSGTTPYATNENAVTSSHSVQITGLQTGINYKIVLVDNECNSSPYYGPVCRWPIQGDCNLDCRVNILDLIYIRNKLNQTVGVDNWQADVNQDGRINILDLIYVREKLNTSCPQ